MQEFKDMLFTFILLGSVLVAGLLALRLGLSWWERRQKLLGIAGMLQSAAWDIVRFMENNPRHTARKNRTAQEAQFQANVVTPSEKLKFPEMAGLGQFGEVFPVFMSAAGERLINHNREEVEKFWFKVQGMRNGIQVFLAIMVLGNITMARVRMIEHMKRQRDEWDGKRKKASPNFVEMKMVLRLPAEWPTGELPEVAALDPLSDSEAIDIATAAGRYRRKILAKLEYKVWGATDEEERLSFAGEELLEAMRDYVR